MFQKAKMLNHAHYSIIPVIQGHSANDCFKCSSYHVRRLAIRPVRNKNTLVHAMTEPRAARASLLRISLRRTFQTFDACVRREGRQ